MTDAAPPAPKIASAGGERRYLRLTFATASRLSHAGAG
jgi:hypothetical protein